MIDGGSVHTANALPIGTAIGGYVVESVLGGSSGGVVYACRDPGLDRRVAVKVLRRDVADADVVARFERARRALAKVQSPHVVSIFAGGECDAGAYVAMELLEGASLQKRLASEGPLPVADVISIALDVARGLRDAAAAGIVHRDVKPANIVLTSAGAVLTDFGLARPVVGSAQITSTGVLTGTPQYLAPEVIRGDAPTTSTDAYALGAIVYEMLAGQPPFSKPTPFETLSAHLDDEVPPLLGKRPDAPVALVQLVHRMLGKNPTTRMGDAEEIIAQLVMVHATSSEGPALDDSLTLPTMDAKPSPLPPSPLPPSTPSTSTPSTPSTPSTSSPSSTSLPSMPSPSMSLEATSPLPASSDATASELSSPSMPSLESSTNLAFESAAFLGADMPPPSTTTAPPTPAPAPTAAPPPELSSPAMFVNGSLGPLEQTQDFFERGSASSAMIDMAQTSPQLDPRQPMPQSSSSTPSTPSTKPTASDSSADLKAAGLTTSSLANAVALVRPLVDKARPVVVKAFGDAVMFIRERGIPFVRHVVDRVVYGPPAVKAAAAGVVIACIGIVVAIGMAVSSSSSPSSPAPQAALDRIAKGDAAVVLAENDLVVGAKRSAQDDVVRAHALYALGKKPDAFTSWAKAAAHGAVDADGRHAAVSELDQKDANAALAMLRGWPDKSLDDELRGIANGPVGWPVHRALSLLEDRHAVGDLDVDAIGVVELRDSPSCDERRIGLDRLARFGHSKQAAQVIEAARKLKANACMRGEFVAAASAVKMRAQTPAK